MKTKCETCDGDGYTLVLNYNGWITHDRLVRWGCKDCQGTGEVEVEEIECEDLSLED